jgi:hypothetical protein
MTVKAVGKWADGARIPIMMPLEGTRAQLSAGGRTYTGTISRPGVWGNDMVAHFYNIPEGSYASITLEANLNAGVVLHPARGTWSGTLQKPWCSWCVKDIVISMYKIYR